MPAPKQRVILAALALRAGQVASYDELAEIVWDGVPPSGARVAIRNYVKRLRQILGPDAGRRIVTRDPGYALEAGPDEVDALRFTALCTQGGEAVRQDATPGSDPGAWELLGEAIGLWRGNPLVDVPSNVLITAEVPRLDALRMQAQEWRMDAGLARGLHSELVGELTQLALDHPWRERFHAQLMLALYRCGRQAEALAAYQRTRRMLVDELGVEPGRELRDLQAGILDADPGLSAPGPALARFLAAPPAAQPGSPGRAGTAGNQPTRAKRGAATTLPARTPAAPGQAGAGRRRRRPPPGREPRIRQHRLRQHCLRKHRGERRGPDQCGRRRDGGRPGRRWPRSPGRPHRGHGQPHSRGRPVPSRTGRSRARCPGHRGAPPAPGWRGPLRRADRRAG